MLDKTQIEKIELQEKLREIIDQRKMIDFLLRERKEDSLLDL